MFKTIKGNFIYIIIHIHIYFNHKMTQLCDVYLKISNMFAFITKCLFKELMEFELINFVQGYVKL